jgi:glycosyltransferase involved in cell wall biosynthesis
MTVPIEKPARVSAIIPARNEEAVIGACVESLARQTEIAEILVVNDESEDRTANIVQEMMGRHPQVELLETKGLPAGWVGKNNAVWLGAREAKGNWLLFTDADAVHERDSAAKALEIADKMNAAIVSFSPEQVMKTWHEKALIPYVYCRLARRFTYEEVNDPANEVAAANGQFLLIRRDAYEAVGGHASVAGEVLEDVALAERVKHSGQRIWFGSGKGAVRVRMYRSLRAMYEGWKKNLYRLMGGSEADVRREIQVALQGISLTLLTGAVAWGLTRSRFIGLAFLSVGILGMSIDYCKELKGNQYSSRLVWYGIPGRLMFAAVLWASYRAHKRGKLKWKGREYPAGTPGASNG